MKTTFKYLGVLSFILIGAGSGFAQGHVPVESISVTTAQGTTVFALRYKQAVAATITIKPDNATNKNFYAVSADPTVALYYPTYGPKNLPDRIAGEGGGETTITFYCEDDPSVCCTIQANCHALVPELTALTLSPETVSVAIGRTSNPVTVIPTPTGAYKTVTWTSADESIATVDENGRVSGIKIGETTVTATSTVNASILATCRVEVTDYVPMQSLKIMPADTTLSLNTLARLRSAFSPDNATDSDLIWSSSDPDIVRVVDEATGELEALAVGEATIRVASKYSPDITSEAAVKVDRITDNAGLYVEGNYRPNDMLKLRIINPRSEILYTTWKIRTPDGTESINTSGEVRLLTGTTTIRGEITYVDGVLETIVKYIVIQ